MDKKRNRTENEKKVAEKLVSEELGQLEVILNALVFIGNHKKKSIVIGVTLGVLFLSWVYLLIYLNRSPALCTMLMQEAVHNKFSIDGISTLHQQNFSRCFYIVTPFRGDNYYSPDNYCTERNSDEKHLQLTFEQFKERFAPRSGEHMALSTFAAKIGIQIAQNELAQSRKTNQVNRLQVQYNGCVLEDRYLANVNGGQIGRLDVSCVETRMGYIPGCMRSIFLSGRKDVQVQALMAGCILAVSFVSSMVLFNFIITGLKRANTNTTDSKKEKTS